MNPHHNELLTADGHRFLVVSVSDGDIDFKSKWRDAVDIIAKSGAIAHNMVAKCRAYLEEYFHIRNSLSKLLKHRNIDFDLYGEMEILFDRIIVSHDLGLEDFPAYNRFVKLSELMCNNIRIFGGVHINQDDSSSLIKGREKAFGDRLGIIDEFCLKNPGAPVSGLIMIVFPELSSLLLKSDGVLVKAPALWAFDRIDKESPPDFIKRTYNEWLGRLSRADIRRLDPKLYMALANWLRTNSMPSDLDLPTLKESNDRWADRVGFVGEGRDAAGIAAREMDRKSSALRRRLSRATSNDENEL